MKKSQKDLILNHLKTYKSISSWEAIQQYRITRLGAIIFNLKEEGFNIVDQWESNENTQWKRYCLEDFKIGPKGQRSFL